jgi:phosphonate transport system substrate-binding protein
VNACGFVPVSTLGRADGSFGITMQLIVPAASLVQTVRDLRGHRLTFTDTTSNSGFKAPVVLLWTDFGLAPDRDYSWGFSFGHEASIRGVADGDLEAAAVASDMLARALGEPDDARRVDAKKLRVIYTSERFPPAALGYAHDLRPELAEAIRGALLEFSWNGTGLDKVFGSDATRFVPVAYKDDFAIVRRIDDALGYPHDVK